MVAIDETLPMVLRKSLAMLIVSLLIVSSSMAQEDYEEEKLDSSRFSFGINFGAHFANNNTANIYSGSPSVTAYGIDFVINQPINQQELQQYFRTTEYRVEEYPVEPIYRTASEIGLHFAYAFDSSFANSIFIDVNIAQLKFEQFFTIGYEDPNNQSIDPTTFERFPLFGEENRFHINLGVQLSLYQSESSNTYFSAFGNVNNVEMRRNYFLINNKEYDIFHRNINRPDQRLGGFGFGGGAGLGFKFKLTEQLLADFYYNAYYTQINLKEDLQPYGVHHAVGLRIIWN